MTLLSLDCLTLTNTSPQDLILSAAAAGFDLVSLWLNPLAPYERQILTPAIARECLALLRDTGIQAHGLEAFDLVSIDAVRAYRPAFELGAQLGGKSVLAYHGANPDRAQVVDAFAEFVSIAREFALEVNLEPVAMGRTRTLPEAEALIRDAGVNAGILFDTYHFVRSGSAMDDLRNIAAGRIRYVQINDGPSIIAADAMRAEAAGERLYPGDGDFPLAEILSAVPVDVPWGFEAPSLSRVKAGMSPEVQAQEAMKAMHRLQSTLRTS